jgi:hypothetical protein
MNYLVIEGYKEAAERFARESNATPGGELAAIEERMQVRSAIQRGDISGAVDRINDLDPELLDRHPRIAFHLTQQLMIEQIRKGDMDSALEYAQSELAPRAARHPEFLRELERTMTLLVMEKGDLADPAHRVKIANEVNSALLAMQSQENASKLPILLRLLHHLQGTLGGRVSFPKIVDLNSAKFDPSLQPSPTDQNIS